MTDKNLGILMAEQAVAAIGSLNNSQKTIDLYEKIRLAQEENESTANAQRRKALPHGVSAIVSIALNLVAEVFKNAKNPMGEAVRAVANITPEAAKVWSSALDGNITAYSHNTRAAELAAQRINQAQSTTDTLISRNVEQVERLLSKEI